MIDLLPDPIVANVHVFGIRLSHLIGGGLAVGVAFAMLTGRFGPKHDQPD